ncbi:hypothetical protein [Thioclava sp. F28-4]|uniref:hypothetical protein n=1 Tax=Thioclava sp. F28-4 TaxID=1915315 RepID=UPI00143B48C1|nr:hypothetical protein [Thioclava sp. F28-4]
MVFLSLVARNPWMFNLHAGIPGVASDLLHSVDKSGILEDQSSSAIISRPIWKKQFRELINTRWREAALDTESWSNVEEILSDFSKYDTVAISQDALLGVAEDSFLKDKVLPQTEARVSRVAEIFSGRSVMLHFTITSQLDYFYEFVRSKNDIDFISEARTMPSWSSLIERIREIVPEFRIMVWDFERPREIALSFIGELLRVDDFDLILDLKDLVSSAFPERQSPLDSESLPGLSFEIIERLDVQYEIDLQRLSKMEGVTLVRPLSQMSQSLGY